VVGTLWPVSDTATALLMARFYELHMGEGLPSPIALSRAQTWLRAATNLDLQGHARLAAKEGRLDSHVAEIEEELSAEQLRPLRNNSRSNGSLPMQRERALRGRPTRQDGWLDPTRILISGLVYPDGARSQQPSIKSGVCY
jgi:CHAT domain-containing protein